MEPKHYNHGHLSLSAPIFLILLLLNNPFPISSHDEHHDRSPPPLASFLESTLMSARKGTSTKGLSLVKNYLSRFGYMDNNNNNDHDYDLFDDALELALKKYQTYFQLPASGALDATTAALLRRPRCGVSDNGMTFKDINHMNRSSYFGESHYTFFPGAPKWPAGKRDLTYSFPPRQSADFLFKFSSEMTNKWAMVSPFKFSYTRDYEHADIKISFARRDHGDGHPFDGPGGDLAHAYEPTDGRIHFDQDDKWVIGAEKDQFDVVTVGVHELGHALGLGHSDDKRAIMYPYMDSGISKNLAQDDIAGIRALYPH